MPNPMGVRMADGRAGATKDAGGHLVATTCVTACCSPGYWRAPACGSPPADPNDPCRQICQGSGGGGNPPPVPPPIYILDTGVCFGRRVQAGNTIKVDGRCYVLVQHLNVLPPGATPALAYQCIDGGCTAPECIRLDEFTGYGVAEPCAADRAIQSPFTRVIFCKCQLVSCITVKGPGTCYKLDPSTPSVVRAATDFLLVIAPGQVTYTNCCDCLTDENTQPVDERCVKCSTISEGWSGPGSGFSVPLDCGCFVAAAACSTSGSGKFERWSVEGNQARYDLLDYLFTNGECGCVGRAAGNFGPIRQRIYLDGVLFSDQFFDDYRGCYDACNGFPGPTTGAPGAGPWGLALPSDPTGPDPNVDGISWSIMRTCTTAVFNYQSGVVGVNGVRATATISRTALVNLPPCNGRCGGGKQPLSFGSLLTPLEDAVRAQTARFDCQGCGEGYNPA